METQSLSLFNLVPDFSVLAQGQFTSSQGLSSVFVVFLLAITIGFLIYAFEKFVRSRKDIKHYLALTREQEKGQLLVNRRQLKENAKKMSDGGNLWREFDESLVVVKKGDAEQLFNSIDAAHFFNTSTLTRSLTENRMLAAVPGFITAFGVIGTFAGLTLGLRALDLGGDIDSLKEGINAMISGASVAFITSLWGVFLSVVFNFIEKWLERGIRSDVYRLQNQIDYLYPRITAEQTLADLEQLNRKSTETLQGLAEEIGNSMQEQMMVVSQNLREGLEESLEKILAPALEKLASDAHEGSSQALESLMDRYMDRIGGIGDTQKAMLESASGSINEASSGMNEGFKSFMTDLDQQMSSVKMVQSDLLEKVKQSTEDQSQAFTTINNNLNEMLVSFKVVTQSNEQASQAFLQSGQAINQSTDVMSSFITKFEQMTTEATTRLNTLIELASSVTAQNKDVGEVLINMLKSSDAAISALTDSTQQLTKLGELTTSEISAVQGHFEQLQTSLQNHVEQLEKQVASLLQDYGEQVQAQTSSRLSVWNTETSQYTGAMKDAITALAGVVEEMEGMKRVAV